MFWCRSRQEIFLFSKVPDRIWSSPLQFTLKWQQWFYHRWSRQNIKLAVQLHLVSRFRICGALPPTYLLQAYCAQLAHYLSFTFYYIDTVSNFSKVAMYEYSGIKRIFSTHVICRLYTFLPRRQQQSEHTDPKHELSNWRFIIANSSVGTEISPI